MDKVRIGRAALHMWEEPCISGERGSGAVFFCGCNLGCVFCQNSKISHGQVGHVITKAELVEEMLCLQSQGANNINLVTAGHYMRTVIPAIEDAKRQGLNIPIVYNTSAYETVDQIKSLEGIVDVYLPDLKYFSTELSGRYSGKADYFDVATDAIDEMVRQTGNIKFVDESNWSLTYTKEEYDEYCDEGSFIMTNGTIVRHLILPGYTDDSKKIIKYLIDKYDDRIFISIMNQYTPMENIKEKYPELDRKVTEAEYNDVLDFAIESGIKYGFFQDGDVAQESFVPEFK